MNPKLAILALCAGAAGCAAPTTVPGPVPAAVPLEVLPASASIATVRADLLATARARFGDSAYDRAMAAPARLIVKRFAGMVPPPPPGAGSDWKVDAPSAMLIREGNQWLVATATGWRQASPQAASQIGALVAGSRLWSESAQVPACPDFGASNLLLKVPDRQETVRSALCVSAAADLVEAALRA